MLTAPLRERMNHKREELYRKATRRAKRRKAYETELTKYIKGLIEDNDFGDFLEASNQRIVFLKSREGMRYARSYGNCAVYALSYAPLAKLEKCTAPSHYSKRREFVRIDVPEAVQYVVTLGEQRGKRIEVEEIKQEIERKIGGLLKKL